MIDCQQFRGVAGGILEGESHPDAYAHLATCPRCRLLVDELGAIERAARDLPTVQPSARLWARLQAAAAREGLWAQADWWGFASEGASWPLRPAFAALLGLTLLLAGSLVAYPTLDLPVARAARVTPYEVAQGELVQDASYETRYHMHLQQVEDQVLAEATPGDKELRQLVTPPLNTVDRAIEQTQLRLADNPDDDLARDELLRLYRQKATVLQAMSDPVWLDVSR